MAKAGDVINRLGDIQGADPVVAYTRGTVLVTKEQADAARPYGWGVLPEIESDSGLVRIHRGTMPSGVAPYYASSLVEEELGRSAVRLSTACVLCRVVLAVLLSAAAGWLLAVSYFTWRSIE